ncbi:MAG: hypothetical protein NUV54_02775, partial [Candidatus Taylorbacteria bacterium]|nr:hypothetical protein [Candidatus Taylorbacteria bacterium]
MREIPIEGADEIMVEFGGKENYIHGRRFCVMMTGAGSNPRTPEVVREALVGLPLDVVLTKEQVVSQCGSKFEELLPKGCLLAPTDEVIGMLESGHRYNASG